MKLTRCFLWSMQRKNAGKGDDFIIERLKKVHKPIYLVINKIDKIHPDKLLDIITEYKDTLDYKEVYPISALQGITYQN